MKIFGWLADHAGCGWYRIILPLGTAGSLGLAECSWSHDIRQFGEFTDQDVLIGQRVFKPGPSLRWQMMAERTKNRPLMVYELDDDLFNIDQDNPAAPTFTVPSHRENMLDNIQCADLVTVSTEPLADQIRKINPRVVVLPNCIPGDLLSWRRSGYNDRIVVGWQGSPTHQRDWEAARVGVQRWFAGYKGDVRVEMHTIGRLPDTFPSVSDHRHDPWITEIPILYKVYDWDIALAPLATTTFNRSKSDIRVLEAAALEIPVVASATPAYRHSVADGHTGILVEKPSDWRRALDRLVGDPVARQWMGANARKWAATRTIETNAHRWVEAYQKARGDAAAL